MYEEESAFTDYSTMSTRVLYELTGMKPVTSIVPLTMDGCMKRVWSPNLKASYVIHVPYGCILHFWGDRVYTEEGFCYGMESNEYLSFTALPAGDHEGVKTVKNLQMEREKEKSGFYDYFIFREGRQEGIYVNGSIDRQQQYMLTVELLWKLNDTEVE